MYLGYTLMHHHTDHCAMETGQGRNHYHLSLLVLEEYCQGIYEGTVV